MAASVMMSRSIAQRTTTAAMRTVAGSCVRGDVYAMKMRACVVHAGGRAMASSEASKSSSKGDVVRVEDVASELGVGLSRCGTTFQPGSVWCVGKNYMEHIGEVDTKMDGIHVKEGRPEYPIIFLKSARAVVGSGVRVVKPTSTEKLDYEGELAVVIGKEARGVRRENAMEYVYGYAVCNDITARDLQKRHQQWSIGKSIDGGLPLGPHVLRRLPTGVAGDGEDADDLAITTFVNGELRQSGRTSQMIFTIPQLVELLSSAGTLYPGDVIATGTPSGVGAGMKPPCFLNPGDVVEVEIENVGRLTTPIA